MFLANVAHRLVSIYTIACCVFVGVVGRDAGRGVILLVPRLQILLSELLAMLCILCRVSLNLEKNAIARLAKSLSPN
jgi:hypothetical protein